jgi:hypothetical protein
VDGKVTICTVRIGRPDCAAFVRVRVGEGANEHTPLPAAALATQERSLSLAQLYKYVQRKNTALCAYQGLCVRDATKEPGKDGRAYLLLTRT